MDQPAWWEGTFYDIFATTGADSRLKSSYVVICLFFSVANQPLVSLGEFRDE